MKITKEKWCGEQWIDGAKEPSAIKASSPCIYIAESVDSSSCLFITYESNNNKKNIFTLKGKRLLVEKRKDDTIKTFVDGKIYVENTSHFHSRKGEGEKKTLYNESFFFFFLQGVAACGASYTPNKVFKFEIII